jgi:hypothetical protein
MTVQVQQLDRMLRLEQQEKEDVHRRLTLADRAVQAATAQQQTDVQRAAELQSWADEQVKAARAEAREAARLAASQKLADEEAQSLRSQLDRAKKDTARCKAAQLAAEGECQKLRDQLYEANGRVSVRTPTSGRQQQVMECLNAFRLCAAISRAHATCS